DGFEYLPGKGVIVRVEGREVLVGSPELLAERGYDPQLGARPLRRALLRLVEDPLSEKLLNKEFTAGEIVVVDTEDDPENLGELRMKFHAVEGFIPPIAIELAGAGDGTTTTSE
ncbi:MAG: hypothetical protein AAB327_05520, partial [Actinomycetota bacterium]